MTQPPKVNKKPKDKRIICYCNGITQAEVDSAILRGCTTLGKIFDATTAGCGPCGGSCQPTLKRMLEAYAESGELLEDPRAQDLRPRKT